MIPPGLQARHYCYVLGPNQDTRLASVTSGQEIDGLLITTDMDAPFVLTSRAVRCQRSTDTGLNQGPLQFLKTRWTGPSKDYRQTSFVFEALQMAYFGQIGNPKPVSPPVVYPPGSTLLVDCQNRGTGSITNLTYFFTGYKLYPPNTVPAYTYPDPMRTQTFAYPVNVNTLAYNETRNDQIFTVKPDADFVLRGIQGVPLLSTGGRVLAEVSIKLMDLHKNPYSSDFVPFDVLAGTGNFAASIPISTGPTYVTPFGTGPGAPGLFWPEIYLPKNYQLLYSLQRAETTSRATETFQFNFIGSKVFPL